MPFFDFPQEELETYRPARREPADFDAFWQAALSEARQHPLNPRFASADFGLSLVETYDVTFAGYGGQPVKGWLMLPRHRAESLPCVVEFIGYGGGRGFPIDWLLWSSAGYAHLVMDTRGQGSTWRPGDTPDSEASNPQHPGFMTRGVLDPKTYYYRRVFTDAVRAVETARSHPAIDPNRVAVTGGSQGGGISIAVGALVPDVLAIMANVPFLCHYRRATEITERAPYAEIAAYCKIHRDKIDTVFNTLSYFDGVNFAPRIHAPALFSVALMDMVCPPSTVYAAYNYLASSVKEIQVWPYNSHEGGESYQLLEQMRFLREHL